MSEEVVGHVDEREWPVLSVQIKGARAEVTFRVPISDERDSRTFQKRPLVRRR